MPDSDVSDSGNSSDNGSIGSYVPPAVLPPNPTERTVQISAGDTVEQILGTLSGPARDSLNAYRPNTSPEWAPSGPTNASKDAIVDRLRDIIPDIQNFSNTDKTVILVTRFNGSHYPIEPNTFALRAVTRPVGSLDRSIHEVTESAHRTILSQQNGVVSMIDFNTSQLA